MMRTSLMTATAISDGTCSPFDSVKAEPLRVNIKLNEAPLDIAVITRAAAARRRSWKRRAARMD
jgi:hypothetical protein